MIGTIKLSFRFFLQDVILHLSPPKSGPHARSLLEATASVSCWPHAHMRWSCLERGWIYTEAVNSEFPKAIYSASSQEQTRVWGRFFKEKMHFLCAVKDTVGKYSLKWWSPLVRGHINLPYPKESATIDCKRMNSSGPKLSRRVCYLLVGRWEEGKPRCFLWPSGPLFLLATPITVLGDFLHLLAPR